MISNEEFEEIVVNVLERDISSNEDQKNAIFSQPNQSLFLVAGPGSGKTTVMVLKILKFIFVDDINPNEILATTFTKKAAEELYSRILGWGDEIKNHIIDGSDDFEIFEKIARIDFNQIQVGTTDKLAEEIGNDFDPKEVFYVDAIEPSELFSVGEEGITFYYDPYELAPYVFGGIQIRIPWDALKY